MRRRSPLSAVQMGVLSALSGVMAVLAYLLIGVFPARFNALGSLGRTLFLLPAALGIAVSFWAQQRLKRGLRKGRWPPGDVESFRIIIISPVWGAGCLACLILCCILLFDSPRFSGLAMGFLFGFQAVSGLQQAVRPKEAPLSLAGDWTNSPKLQSQHWGER